MQTVTLDHHRKIWHPGEPRAKHLRDLIQNAVDGGLPSQKVPQVAHNARIGLPFKDNDRSGAHNSNPGTCAVRGANHDSPRARVLRQTYALQR